MNLAGRLRLLFRPARLAVVLGGGGTRGAFQVGVIDVLARAGVVPDLLVGTSVGAINATFWAFHPETDVAERLFALWLEADRSVVLPRPFAALRHLVRGQHLVTHDALRRLLARGLVASDRLEAARIPLTVVATDAERGDPVRLRSGPAIPAVLASTSVPGLFAPVSVDGRDLVDGGVVANCDVEAALQAGATDIVVIDLMGAPGRLPGSDLLLTIERTLDLTLGRQTDAALAAARERARVVLVRAPRAVLPRFGDFEATEALFEAGRLAGRSLLSGHLRGRRVREGSVVLVGSEPAQPGP